MAVDPHQQNHDTKDKNERANKPLSVEWTNWPLSHKNVHNRLQNTHQRQNNAIDKCAANKLHQLIGDYVLWDEGKHDGKCQVRLEGSLRKPPQLLFGKPSVTKNKQYLGHLQDAQGQKVLAHLWVFTGQLLWGGGHLRFHFKHVTYQCASEQNDHKNYWQCPDFDCLCFSLMSLVSLY